MTHAVPPRPAADTLPSHLSLYLDAVRFAAAAVVFLGHFATQRISGGLFYQFEWFGPSAVDVFFVLSGFVIAHVVATRETNAADYTIHRAARILSVVVPALVLTAVLDAAGMAANPEFYRHVPNFDPAHALVGYPASLAFLHQAWFASLQPGSNVPYWSMGFEVWYYVLFGFAGFARGGWRWAGSAGVLLLAGPKVALLLPVWLLGVVAWRLCQGRAPSRAVALLWCLGPLAVMASWHGWVVRGWEPYHRFAWGDPALLDAVNDYAVGVAFAVHLIGMRWLLVTVPAIPAGVVRAVRWLAAGSFGLYLFHYPVLHFLAAVLPWPPGSLPSRLVIGLGTPAGVLLLARLAERQKGLWRAWMRTLFIRSAVP
jgi:peptidoglycan/LPS O-acetylase OafA/YrhL